MHCSRLGGRFGVFCCRRKAEEIDWGVPSGVGVAGGAGEVLEGDAGLRRRSRRYNASGTRANGSLAPFSLQRTATGSSA